MVHADRIGPKYRNRIDEIEKRRGTFVAVEKRLDRVVSRVQSGDDVIALAVRKAIVIGRVAKRVRYDAVVNANSLDRIAVVVHHLATDGVVGWRSDAYEHVGAGQPAFRVGHFAAYRKVSRRSERLAVRGGIDAKGLITKVPVIGQGVA